MGRRDSHHPLIFRIARAEARRAVHCNCELFLAEMLPLLLNIRLLFGAGGFEPAGAYERDNAAEFVTVKPAPVAFANVHDHAGAAREIDPIHQL
jgi:hypothetical protein